MAKVVAQNGNGPLGGGNIDLGKKGSLEIGKGQAKGESFKDSSIDKAKGSLRVR